MPKTDHTSPEIGPHIPPFPQDVTLHTQITMVKTPEEMQLLQDLHNDRIPIGWSIFCFIALLWAKWFYEIFTKRPPSPPTPPQPAS